MANISEYRTKDGSLAFNIRVYRGRDKNGKPLRPFSTTFRAEPTWADRTARKKAKDFAAVFEQKCKTGVISDDKITFQKYADYVIELKAKNGTLKHSTEVRYRSFTKRLYSIMGNIKIKDIKPQFLNNLYNELLETPIDRNDHYYGTKKLQVAVKNSNLSKSEICRQAHCSVDTLNRALNFESLTPEKATAISNVLNCDVEILFKIEKCDKFLSSKTVCEYHSFISSVLSQAEKEMIVPYNMATRATPPQRKHKEANYFEPNMIKQIESAFDKESIPNRMLGYLLIFTGARRGEILGLEWHNIDFERNTIKIEKNVLYTSDIGVYVDTPKTETSKRIIAMPKLIMDMLLDYKKYYDEIRDGLSWKYTTDNDFLFVQENGKPINPTYIKSWLKRVEDKNALPHLNAHAFRHSVASALIFHGVDPVSVSKRLGHNQVSTTTNIYSHIMSAAEKQNAEILSEIFA